MLGACALGVLLAAAGCSRSRITVDIDVASFLDPADLTGSYAAPAQLPAVEVALEPIALDVSQANQEFLRAEQLDLDMAVRFDNTSGEGEALVTVFLGDTAESVFDTPAVTSIHTSLAPAQSSTGTAEFRADARVLDLFRSGQLWMGLRLNWSPATGEALAGEYTITRIHARIMTRVDLL